MHLPSLWAWEFSTHESVICTGRTTLLTGQLLHRICSKLCETQLGRCLSSWKTSLHRFKASLKSPQKTTHAVLTFWVSTPQLYTDFQVNVGDEAQPLLVVTPTQDISERSQIGVYPDHMNNQKGWRIKRYILYNCLTCGAFDCLLSDSPWEFFLGW